MSAAAFRVVHIVGAFDGVVLRSILAPSIEAAKARATAYAHEFAAAQNANRTELGSGINVALDFYIAAELGWMRFFYRWSPRQKYASEPTWTLSLDENIVAVEGWTV